ncbi:hypothetical protein [Natronomonas sp. EA1]|uniref:hypothetical protein n=1 Tax=Natronomonas sp. EA1 TaxID=3421655 RepID=UPI003EBF6F4C
MDTTTVLREAGSRLRDRQVLPLLVGFLLVSLATAVARQTLLDASLTQFLAAGGDPATLPVPPEELRPIPLALPVGYSVAVLGAFALALVSEYLTVVTLRVYAGESLGDAARRRVIGATSSGFLVGIMVRGLVVAGLVAFVIPGIFFAIVFLFAHARVAIEDENVFAALRGSYRLTEGHRLSVLGVVALLLSLYLVPQVVGSFLPTQETGLLVAAVVRAPVLLLSSGVVARAYVALRDAPVAPEEPAEETDEDDEDEEDYWNQPLGADDLPEP